MTYALRWLGNPTVEVNAGKLIAFWDQQGHGQIIVEEDAYPARPEAICPTVTIHLPGLSAASLRGDTPFSILDVRPDQIRLSLHLAPHQCARLELESGDYSNPRLTLPIHA